MPWVHGVMLSGGMTKYLVVLIGVLSLATVARAQSPQATSDSLLAWDYPDQWVAEFSVMRFELQIDGFFQLSARMSALPEVPETYATAVPALPTGQHVVEVRACNISGCGPWSSALLFYFMGDFPPLDPQLSGRAKGYKWPPFD